MIQTKATCSQIHCPETSSRAKIHNQDVSKVGHFKLTKVRHFFLTLTVRIPKAGETEPSGGKVVPET